MGDSRVIAAVKDCGEWAAVTAFKAKLRYCEAGIIALAGPFTGRQRLWCAALLLACQL